MDINTLREEIKIKLTGGILELELEDSIIDRLIASAMREVQRYINTTKLITIPYEGCIDLSKLKDSNNLPIKVSTITRIYRNEGYVSSNSGSGVMDPLYASQWQLLSGTGNLYNFQDYALNYMSWNTLLQIRNTTSTDLAFKYDKANEKLYINIATDKPAKITLEYIPRFDSIEEVNSDYWIDVIFRLSTALCKIALGRIRTRYTQSNALWTQDGETMLNEGNTELTDIRNSLQNNILLCYPYD